MSVTLDLLLGAGQLIGETLGILDGDKKEKAQLILKQIDVLAQQNHDQAEINKAQVQHRSIFVAGPRPAIMWVCVAGLTSEWLIRPWAMSFYPELNIPSIGPMLLELILALSGLAGLRTFEKKLGLTK